jgi:hypothetical protein
MPQQESTMKALLISGLSLAILAGGAWAQDAAPAPAGGAPAQMDMKAPPPPPPGIRPPPGGPDAMQDEGPGGPPPKGLRGRRPPPESKAAHFRVQQGDTALDIKCADDEPMQACAYLTMQLLNKLGAMPRP